MTLLLPLACDVKNGYRHTDKLYIKLKTWFNFCACIMNSKAQLPAVITIKFLKVANTDEITKVTAEIYGTKTFLPENQKPFTKKLKRN